MHPRIPYACLFALSLLHIIMACARGADYSPRDKLRHPSPMVGPVGGVNFAFISIDPNEGMDLRTHIRATAGIALLLPIGGSENQGQLELVYIGKGVKNELTDTTESITLDYLCLSPMLHLNVGKQPGFFLRVGPELGLLLKSRYIMETGGERSSRDTKEQYSDFELGVKGGAGVNIRLTRQLIAQVNFAYSVGIVDILTGPGTDGEFITRGLQIHAGLLIPLRVR